MHLRLEESLKQFDYAIPLNNTEPSPVRLLLQGTSGSGKTTSALTFPNLLIVDFDNKLGDHRHRADVQVLPFHSKSFIEKLLLKEKLETNVMLGGQLNSAIMFSQWLKKNVETIPADMTLVVDSGNMLVTALDVMIEATDKKKDDGESVNKFASWGRKLTLLNELLTHIKKLKCKFIWIAHEAMSLDQDGNSSGKWNPLISGATKDNFPGNFTHRFRQTAEENKTTKEIEYWWQISQSKLCDCFCPLEVNKKKGPKVLANYNNITW